MPQAKQLILFDIDGTLIRTYGCGRRSLELASQELWSSRIDWQGYTFSGKTDPIILREVASRALNRPITDEEYHKLARTYLDHLTKLIPTWEQFVVLPGVVALLGKLADRDDLILGIQTGNLRQAVDLKLSHARIDRHFQLIACGSDSPERSSIVRSGIDRAREFADLDRVLVIGDAPQDIRAAKANGALSIAVLTGGFESDVLAKEEPSHILNDLSDAGSLLDLL